MNIDWSAITAAIKEVGYPAVASGVLLWCAAQIWRFLAYDVMVPIRDAVVGLLASLKDSVKAINSNLDAQTESLQRIDVSQARIEGSLRDMVEHGCGAHRHEHKGRNGTEPKQWQHGHRTEQGDGQSQ